MYAKCNQYVYEVSSNDLNSSSYCHLNASDIHKSDNGSIVKCTVGWEYDNSLYTNTMVSEVRWIDCFR